MNTSNPNSPSSSNPARECAPTTQPAPQTHPHSTSDTSLSALSDTSHGDGAGHTTTSRAIQAVQAAASAALTLATFRHWVRQRARTHPDGQDVPVGTSAGSFDDCPLAHFLGDQAHAPVVTVGPLQATLYFGAPERQVGPGDWDDVGVEILLPDWAQTFIWAVDRAFKTADGASILGAPVSAKQALRLLTRIEQGRLVVPMDERPASDTPDAPA